MIRLTGQLCMGLVNYFLLANVFNGMGFYMWKTSFLLIIFDCVEMVSSAYFCILFNLLIFAIICISIYRQNETQKNCGCKKATITEGLK